MLNVIEPTDHILRQNEIDPLLRLFKVYQDFELSSKVYDKAIFIVAKDENRGVYGGAAFFPQKVKELEEDLSDFLSISENRTIWCARLCLCTEQDDQFTTLEALELCQNFYAGLYDILSVLGDKRGTNCLPLKLHLKDYRNSLTYGNWVYFAKLPANDLSSDYVYALLALPDKKQLPQPQLAKEPSKGKNLEVLPPTCNQNLSREAK